MESEVEIVNRNGEKLAATWNQAAGSSPTPAVLLCQGLSGVRNLVLPTVAAALGAVGISSIRFDYAGFGDSDGVRGWIDPGKRLEDARFVLAWLLGNQNVAPERIGVYGHSYGGPIAIGLAAGDHRIGALAAVSCPGPGDELLRSARPAWEWVAFKHRLAAERAAIAGGAAPTVVDVNEILPFSPKFKAAYEKLKARQGGSSALPGTDGLGKNQFYLASVDLMCDYELVALAEQIANCATLFVNGEDDDTAPVEILRPVFERVSATKRWHTLPEADHNSLDTEPGLSQALVHVTSWFTEELKPW